MNLGQDHVKWFFQFVFAATSATIVSGAMAERTNFYGYVIYSFFMTGLIYPVVSHWCWDSRGWLASMTTPYMDFAGSGVVHVLGGTAALVGSNFLGARIGKFDEDGKPRILQPSSTFLTCLGSLLLWFGFLAFNAGSALSLRLNSQIGVVLMNTILSGCSGSLTAFILGKLISKKYQLISTLDGNLAGMVSICAGASSVGSGSAILIGCISALVDRGFMEALLWLQIDDPLDAIGVHLGGGAWGLIAVALFNEKNGLFFGGGFSQLGSNVIGLGVIVLWSSCWSIFLFGGLRLLNLIRVTPEQEKLGLDHTEHHEVALAFFSSSSDV
eukprot:TRINITY_DN1337_c0_g1_i1.p1 TRINITY_DN1337_c0_g1~~TRINITY_DN1337_c0_g1_i1.p1  ORF type:complete len:327 (+),score=46.29 TRINITY_DN1337_c0_g1_i1:627-1607(+)